MGEAWFVNAFDPYVTAGEMRKRGCEEHRNDVEDGEKKEDTDYEIKMT